MSRLGGGRGRGSEPIVRVRIDDEPGSCACGCGLTTRRRVLSIRVSEEPVWLYLAAGHSASGWGPALGEGPEFQA